MGKKKHHHTTKEHSVLTINPRESWIFILLSLALTLPIFVYALAPTITFEDSGELITAASILGIAHPPGFPTWVLIAHLFSYIPFSTIAWRINLLSAVSASISAGLIVYIGMRIKTIYTKTQGFILAICAVFSSIIFSFTKTIFSQAVIAEVYTLMCVFILLQILLLSLFIKTKKKFYVYATSLIFGLSVGIHYLAIPFGISWVLFLSFTHRKDIVHTKTLIFSFVSLIVGLCVFLYIPLRAPLTSMNWGHIENTHDVLFHIQRKQFATNIQYDNVNAGIYIPSPTISDSTSFISRIFLFPLYQAVVMSRILTPILTLIGYIGLFFIVKDIRKTHTSLSSLLAISFFVYTGIFDFLLMPTPFTIHDSRTLFIEHTLHLVFFTFFICFGLNKILTYSAKLVQVLIYLIIVSHIGYLLYTNYMNYSMRGNTTAYDHAQAVLKTPDEHAMLFLDKNNWLFPVLYLHEVEHVRPDITLFDRTGNLFEDIYHSKENFATSIDGFEQYRIDIEESIASNSAERSVYFAADKNFENYEHNTAQEGILYKHVKDTARNIDIEKEYATLLSASIDTPDNNTSYMRAYYHLRLIDSLISERKFQEAHDMLLALLDTNSYYHLVYSQIGTYLGNLEDYTMAKKAYKKALALNPTDTKSLKNMAIVSSLINTKQTSTTIMELVKNGKCEQAEHMLDKLTPENPDASRLYNNTGICYAQENNIQKAITLWKKATVFNPHYLPAKENLKKAGI